MREERDKEKDVNDFLTKLCTSPDVDKVVNIRKETLVRFDAEERNEKVREIALRNHMEPDIRPMERELTIDERIDMLKKKRASDDRKMLKAEIMHEVLEEVRGMIRDSESSIRSDIPDTSTGFFYGLANLI